MRLPAAPPQRACPPFQTRCGTSPSPRTAAPAPSGSCPCALAPPSAPCWGLQGDGHRCSCITTTRQHDLVHCEQTSQLCDSRPCVPQHLCWCFMQEMVGATAGSQTRNSVLSHSTSTRIPTWGCSGGTSSRLCFHSWFRACSRRKASPSCWTGSTSTQGDPAGCGRRHRGLDVC